MNMQQIKHQPVCESSVVPSQPRFLKGSSNSIWRQSPSVVRQAEGCCFQNARPVLKHLVGYTHDFPRLPLTQIRSKLFHKVLMPDKGSTKRHDLAAMMAHEMRIKPRQHHSYVWLVWDGPIRQRIPEYRPLQRVVHFACSPISPIVEGNTPMGFEMICKNCRQLASVCALTPTKVRIKMSCTHEI